MKGSEVRAEFDKLGQEYPRDPSWRDPGFANNTVVTLLKRQLPAALIAALPELKDRYIIKGSAGDGTWTFTPWIAVLDPAETTTVQEGIYVVYLMSKGGERLYLTLNQGCTRLKNGPGGLPNARAELGSRASTMWRRARQSARRLAPLQLDLNVPPNVWRGKLYERGVVAGVEYDMSSLPSEADMIDDLREAVDLYRKVLNESGWATDDSVEQAAMEDGVSASLEQAKRYHQHRRIERQPSHAKKVKKALGSRCMACDQEMGDVYGPIADGMIDAHHLIPLGSLADGSTVTFSPTRDFAVLCPNCHRAIHRSADPSDVGALRGALDRSANLKKC